MGRYRHRGLDQHFWFCRGFDLCSQCGVCVPGQAARHATSVAGWSAHAACPTSCCWFRLAPGAGCGFGNLKSAIINRQWLRRLLESGRQPRVIPVVRPDICIQTAIKLYVINEGLSSAFYCVAGVETNLLTTTSTLWAGAASSYSHRFKKALCGAGTGPRQPPASAG